MAMTPSIMTPLGSRCPDFSLPDPVSGTARTRDEVAGPRGLLVMFICNHCPFVIHIAGELASLGRWAEKQGIGVVAIGSNDAVTHPADAPDMIPAECERRGYRFPYLFDASQDVARAFDAACTPDFFLYDADGLLRYRGQLDGSRPGNGVPVTGEDLRAACSDVAAGRVPGESQTPSIGCNIKWSTRDA